MSNIPHYENDLNTAMFYKGQHPECYLIVSLEDSNSNSQNFKDFWGSAAIVLNLNSNYIITRLSESENPEGYKQFLNLFKVTDVPSIIIFGPNTPNITKTFYPYPDPATLVKYFNDEKNISKPEEKPKVKPQEPKVKTEPKSETTPNVSNTTTKISVKYQTGRSFTHVFEKTDTVGDLKHWIETEIGSDVFPDLIIAHSNSPLPEDDSMTLEKADLCPSALLKILSDDLILSIHVENGTDDVEVERNGHKCCPCNFLSCGFFNSSFFKWPRIFFSVLNPYGDDPGQGNHDQDPNGDNEIWQYRPNPQLAQNIRDALNMQRRNGGVPNNFAEV